MPRAWLTILATLAVAVPAGAAAAPARAAAPSAPGDAAHARLVACHTGADPTARWLTVDASMRTLEGTARMQLRFDLYRQRAGRLVAVAGPGLGSWNDATPGVARLRFRKTIANLPAPGTYRVLVRFRWLDGGSLVLARARRLTAACVQPDPRPDLRVRSLLVAPAADPARRTYLVTVRNAGRSPAADFDVVLAVDGADQPAVTVAGLAPGATRAVSISGPRCAAGGTVQVTVDPDDRVDESIEANNRRTFPCP
jgi:hypothetical protein